ncbi:MAG TPA: tetratricopeptide repeat protein [Opitutus sp.]|nr:tetratricopeptide repeat protein [Opitutus sp.]
MLTSLRRHLTPPRLATAALSWSLLGTVVMLVSFLPGCRRAESVVPPIPRVSAARAQTSDTCLACHAEIHAKWRNTDHELANRLVDRASDEEAFTASSVIIEGHERLASSWSETGPRLVEITARGERFEHHPDMVLGNQPSRQMLVPMEGGRWQPTEFAWDPARKDWFNVFGDEERHRGEWGHWTGRGMNWNSMCAHCHMTGFEKNYHASADTFSSTWVEQGVGCIQCHGPMPSDHDRTPKREPKSSATGWIRDPQRVMQTCASCHARNERLTLDFQPGDTYDDHHRLTLPVDPAIFHPDGQQRDEVFNWTSVRLSRMGHAGVTCMDCHDPHTTKLTMPVENNALCLQCHSGNGRLPAPVIDPIAHSRHAAGSAGNRCVECHMPTTNYMERSPRHDHAWLKPDPLLTKELGIPNACNRCHTDQTVDWAIAHSESWYGEKLNSRQRARARGIAAAQTNSPGAVDQLLRLLESEDIPVWRATMLDLMTPHARQNPGVVSAANPALKDSDALVRAAAVRLLGGVGDARASLRPLLNDPVRLVRLDAAWALSDELEPASTQSTELGVYLATAAEQPLGQLRIGQHLANHGDSPAAIKALQKAVSWDPGSAPILETLALVYQQAGQLDAAANAFVRAANLTPDDPEPIFNAALLYAEARRYPDAETALRETVRRDSGHHRAWYNLGLLLVETGRLTDAQNALITAEETDPTSADYPYALATVYWKTGDRAAARSAAERALAINPAHANASALLRALN